MANITATTLRSDMLQKSQVHEIQLAFKFVSGTPSLLSPSKYAPVLYSQAAILQAPVDALLGSSNEIAATTAFGATAMGTDAFAIVLDTKGQVAELEMVTYQKSGAAAVHIVPSGSAMPNTLTEDAFLTSAGNLAARIIITSLDSADTTLLVSFRVKLKTAA